MSGNKIFGIIFMLFITTASAAILSTGCYDDNEARVTIHLERNDLAFQGDLKQKRVIDRILEFFTTPAFAVAGWDSSHGELTLKIRSSSFSEMTYPIPQSATTYTVTVPAGQSITFEVISYTTGGAVPYNWGGHKTLDIDPGEQDLTLNMIPMTLITNIPTGSILTVYWEQPTAWVTNYRLYRSDSPEGPYVKIGSDISSTQSSTSGGTTLMGNTYYYKLSVVYNGEEGVMSAYAIGLCQ